LNNSNGHMHVQGPSTATYMVLTTYHNIPLTPLVPGMGAG
jgi:hypothetical protein